MKVKRYSTRNKRNSDLGKSSLCEGRKFFLLLYLNFTVYIHKCTLQAKLSHGYYIAKI